MVEKWLKNHQANKTPVNAAVDPEKTHVSKDSWASKGDGLQRRASQKELRKTFARSKAINANRTYDEYVNSRAQEPLTSTANKKTLVSKFFDVHAGTTVLPSLSNSDEVQVPWGKGIIGYVAEHGETVNIPDAYQDRRFSDEIDKLTGYKTKSLLCMPIRNSDGEIIGVAQAINKDPGGALFTEDDEKVSTPGS
ncbi:hypothetical protein JZ751_025450 [Albula glossodonta]|uniref:GAF domain-containing protein n=1 Tax=Albula glossodonta TaxID=121402 RepID=A0A8T2NLV3_9TELE|nr:hypothetical protein JZ751_025450 [Albula glossodonta]